MTDEEIAWLDAYHARVRDTLAPLVDAQTREWLIAATAPLALSMSRKSGSRFCERTCSNK